MNTTFTTFTITQSELKHDNLLQPPCTQLPYRIIVHATNLMMVNLVFTRPHYIVYNGTYYNLSIQPALHINKNSSISSTYSLRTKFCYTILWRSCGLWIVEMKSCWEIWCSARDVGNKRRMSIMYVQLLGTCLSQDDIQIHAFPTKTENRLFHPPLGIIHNWEGCSVLFVTWI